MHFNSARTGVRLIGPTPRWARSDGGEAGLHPSNLHDNAYAIGAIDFTGDMPIILGPDGPSLGGFVCPAVIAGDEQWKMGQLKPGDRVRFHPLAREKDPVAGPVVHRVPEAASPILARRTDGRWRWSIAGRGMTTCWWSSGTCGSTSPCACGRICWRKRWGRRSCRASSTSPPASARSSSIIDGTRLTRTRLLGLLDEIERSLPAAEDVVVPSRIVHLPLSWDDPDAQLAMRKYQELVRPNAPWCPSNIEFIRRINGLADEKAVQDIVFDALLSRAGPWRRLSRRTGGDPGGPAPPACHHQVQSGPHLDAGKRGGHWRGLYVHLWHGGAGRLPAFRAYIQMWNTWRTTPVFRPGTPWLLRFFDQVRFFPVSHAELTEARAAFPHGAYPVKIEETQFSYAEYAAGLARDAGEITAFKDPPAGRLRGGAGALESGGAGQFHRG